MTLIELLVAVAISMVVAIAAISALTVSQRGFRSVDAASQLRDNARFAVSLLQRVSVQAGFKDVAYAATTRPASTSGVSADPDPPVFGFNNAIPNNADPAHLSTPGGINNSDVLVLRYQAPETFTGSGRADASIIDCAGDPAATTAVPAGRDSVITSILYVDTYKGEPSLMCRTIAVDSIAAGSARPVVTGVETFQVLYGLDAAASADSVAESFLRADQITSNADWRRVRSLRIGLVMRAAPGSTPDTSTLSFAPLGPIGGTNQFVAPGDGRLRQATTLTVHMRNDLSL